MRTLVLGSQGQLARDLLKYLPGEVLPWTRQELDLSQPASVASALNAAKPDIVINCAAYNFVDKAEDEPEAAYATNAWGVRALAQTCGNLGIRLVQISSDYVFGLDAELRHPLTESERTGPVSVYGASKLAGEFFTRMYCPKHLVLRTCGLYGVWGSGGKGGNFIETMLKVAGMGKPLRVVHDQHCTPTSTHDLAVAIVALIRSDVYGLFHLTNSGHTTWHDLAAEAFRLSGVKADLTPITSAEFGAKAKRPPYSVLDCGKADHLGIHLRPWQEALAYYLEERKKRG
jgi:dTDP-4-dehydrorhamnose reductase